jgi:hypothetical protein
MLKSVKEECGTVGKKESLKIIALEMENMFVAVAATSLEKMNAYGSNSNNIMLTSNKKLKTRLI